MIAINLPEKRIRIIKETGGLIAADARDTFIKIINTWCKSPYLSGDAPASFDWDSHQIIMRGEWTLEETNRHAEFIT